MATCVQIGKAVTATRNVDQILSIVVNRLSELIPARNWTLHLVDPKDQTLVFTLLGGTKNRWNIIASGSARESPARWQKPVSRFSSPGRLQR